MFIDRHHLAPGKELTVDHNIYRIANLLVQFDQRLLADIARRIERHLAAAQLDRCRQVDRIESIDMVGSRSFFRIRLICCHTIDSPFIQR